MLNKEALEAATAVYTSNRRGAFITILAPPEAMRLAIEAYHAALPDEGLVKEIREEAEEQENGNVGDGACTADVLRRAADALEGARTAIPEGWRLVPEEPTDEMYEAGAKALHIIAQDLDHDETGAGMVFDAMIAVAPEIKR